MEVVVVTDDGSGGRDQTPEVVVVTSDGSGGREGVSGEWLDLTTELTT